MKEHKPEQVGWKHDKNGMVSSRALAEMIVSSLLYAKPPLIVEKDYDRAVDIAEEEINVRKVFRDLALKDKLRRK